MRLKSVTILLTMAALCGAANAQPVFELEPGKWEMTLTMTNTTSVNGMSIPMPPTDFTTDYCITEENSRLTPEKLAKMMTQNPEMGDVQCDLSDVIVKNRKMEYTATCEISGMNMVMKNEFTLAADGKSMSGTGENNVSGNGMSMISKTKTTQKHMGGC